MRRVLVTGGAGFIGSHLVEALLAEGWAVRVLDNLSTGRRENLAAVEGRYEWMEGDIRDPATVARAVEGVDAILHEAAMVSVPLSVERPAECHAINLVGTLHLLEAARMAGVRRLIMASTAAAYGNNPELPKRETMPPEPESPYGATKVAAELYLRAWARMGGLETASLRYFNVYGPRQDPRSMYSGVISRFVEALSTGEPPTVYGDGTQTRDFIYVGDVVRANLLALRAPRLEPGALFNIGTGRSVSLLELLETLSGVAGRAMAPRFAPARAGDVTHSRADPGRARALLGFEATTSLAEGLARLWQWRHTTQPRKASP